MAGQDGEQRMTAFNMREELEEGHFDRDGHFIWKNEKEVTRFALADAFHLNNIVNYYDLLKGARQLA